MILLLPSISLVGRTLPSSFIQRASTSSYHHYPRVFSSIITPTTTTATSFKLFELSGKINDDDGGGGPIGRDTKITVNRSDEAAIATATATIRTMIKRDRIIQQLGLVIGIVLILTAIGVGCGARLIDPTLVGICSAILTIIGMLYTESHNEYRVAMSDSCFVVRDSTIANAGKGLFATTKIKEGTYLMEYEGEIYSNEDQYFDRYPNGDGKYVAEIQRSLFQAPFYIDCVDPSKSNLARYMNSATTCSSPQTSSHTSSNNDTNTNTAESITANVISKKQRYGKQAGSMYFYTSRDIVDGEELFFDYGADYWTKFAELGLK